MRTPDKAALIDKFSQRYRASESDILQRIEQSIFGCAYGANSWTTRDEAENVAKTLELGPGKRLLEVGTGTGWPGLYLASLTGCEVALIDLPLEGLRVAARRASTDDIADRCWPIMADGVALPFEDSQFDAVFHSDVLCCLEDKRAVLKECRRVIRGTGRMMFSVISVAPDPSHEDHHRAASFGPEFVEAPADYPSMVRDAGWQTTARDDVTAKFGETVGKLVQQEERHAKALIDLLGETQYSERAANLRKRLAGVERKFIRRDMYTAVPAPI